MKRELVAGSISLIAYLFVVVITTPNLPALTAFNVAIKVNGIIVFGLAIAVGSQIYLSNYGKRLGCGIVKKRKVILGSSIVTSLSSFFSLFSSVPLGCCGIWLLILSLLPSVFGSGLSVSLIQYSRPLSYLGLFIVIGYTAFTAFKLKSESKKMQKVEAQRKTPIM